MEKQAGAISKKALTGADLWLLSRSLFEGENAIVLELPDRADDRAALDFTQDNFVTTIRSATFKA